MVPGSRNSKSLRIGLRVTAFGLALTWMLNAAENAPSSEQYELGKRPPIILRGVVCFYSPERKELFLQNDSGGILVRPGPETDFELGVGQLLEVEGEHVLRRGGPELSAGKIRLLGEGPLPAQLQPTYEQMAAGEVDCCYCQFGGVVRSLDDTTHDGLLSIDIAGYGGRVTAFVRNYDLAECKRLIDAEVRISGVCSRELDADKRCSQVTLRVSGMGGIAVIRPASADPFSAELRSIASLSRIDVTSTHRVKVQGVVSLHERGVCSYIENGPSGLRVESSQPTLLRAGDRVEVVGFPAPRQTAPPILENAVFRKVGTGPGPVPYKASAQDLQSGACFGRLVTIEASSCASSGINDDLRLQVSNVSFTAKLLKGSVDELPKLPQGTPLRITGVALKLSEPEFGLVLRSSSDIETLKGPARRGKLIFCALVALMGTVFWFLKARGITRRGA